MIIKDHLIEDESKTIVLGLDLYSADFIVI